MEAAARTKTSSRKAAREAVAEVAGKPEEAEAAEEEAVGKEAGGEEEAGAAQR